MKQLLVFSLLILTACSEDKKSEGKQVLSFDPRANADYSLVGHWQINGSEYITDSSESASYCNACPSIDFDMTNTALISFPDDTKESYTWYIMGDTLLLQLAPGAKTTMPYFLHLKYKISFKKETEFVRLKLSPTKDFAYLLSR